MAARVRHDEAAIDRHLLALHQTRGDALLPNRRTPARPMKDIRHSWAKALEDAGLEYFWIYNLRHTFASRMSAAGVSDLFVGQIIGHKTPGILQKYSRAIDEYRRDAVRKLEDMRAKHVQRDPISTTIN